MSTKNIAYFLTLGSIVILLGAGCATRQANTTPPEKNTTTENIKTYTVDEFVESGFKQGEKVQIQIKSVTCYNNSCGLEGGGKWGITMNIADSKVFYPYAAKAVDMVVEAEPDCPIEAQQCNTIKNVVIVKPDQNNQNEPSTISTDTSAELNDIFLSSIPKSDFAHLTLKDFPSIQANYGMPKAVTWNGKIFIPSNTSVIEYDFNGKILGYTDWRKVDCANDIQVINNSLYIACRDKGIYEVDLSSNKMVYLYDQKDGIKELRNLQLTADGENLWVGTYNGVAKIETTSRKVQFYQSELGGTEGKEGPAFGSTVYARNSEVWATVSANANNNGAVSNYNYANNQWTVYSIKDFKRKDLSRLDIDRFIVSDNGIYASFQDGGPQNVVLKKFDPTSKKWNEIYHAEYTEFNKNVAQHLPALETYASSEMQFDQNENLPTVKIFDQSKWKSIPIMGVKYIALSPFVKNAYYLLSANGLYTLTQSDNFPKFIAASKVFTLSDSTSKFFATDDQKYVVFLSAAIDAMGGDTYAYDIGVHDTEKQTFFDVQLNRKAYDENFPAINIEKAELKYQDGKFTIPAPQSGDMGATKAVKLVVDIATQRAYFSK